jgi:ubiquinone/menaquinone biosynthesis C-methylase UbiE
MSEQGFPAFLYEIFHPSLPRLGPGADGATRKALDIATSNTSGSSQKLKILDIGCGNGTQTLQLAKHSESKILAVDNYLPFLEELQGRAEAQGVSGKIETTLKDMHELSLEEGSFDIIWSEGALYIMGFRNGLKHCFPLLVPGGVMAVTELSWLRPDPPGECRQFFAEEYPDMMNIDGCLSNISDVGYDVLYHFILPKSAWLTPFYEPLGSRLQELRGTYSSDSEKLAMIASVQKEIDIFHRYSNYYGYVFYIMQRK